METNKKTNKLAQKQIKHQINNKWTKKLFNKLAKKQIKHQINNRWTKKLLINQMNQGMNHVNHPTNRSEDKKKN